MNESQLYLYHAILLKYYIKFYTVRILKNKTAMYVYVPYIYLYVPLLHSVIYKGHLT